MSELRSPLRKVLKDPIDRERQEQICQAVLLRRRTRAQERTKHPLRVRMPALAAVTVAGLVILSVFAWRGDEPSQVASSPGPIVILDEGPLSTVEVPSNQNKRQHLRLSDGSVLDLTPGAAIEALSNTGEIFEVRLLQGKVFFDVHPGGPRRWVVDAGLAQIEVTGTVFMLERTPQSVVVAVERGSVTVRSEELDDGEQHLAVGESLMVRAPDQEVAASIPEPEDEADAEPLEPEAETILLEDPETATITPEDGQGQSSTRLRWHELVSQGEYHQAYELLGSRGVSRATSRAASMDELLGLADVARLSGHPSEAVAPFERALGDFPNDRRAPIAAFTLGRLELDVMGRPVRAAQAFERCIALGAPHALQADAFARLAQARTRAGDPTRAREAAQEYLRRFPNGRRAPDMQRLLEPTP